MRDDSTMSGEPTDPALDPVYWQAFSKMMRGIRTRYPDFELFHDEMLRLCPCFKPGDVALDVYIEGLYLIAKFASYPQAPGALPDQAWMLANQKAEPANKPSGLQ